MTTTPEQHRFDLDRSFRWLLIGAKWGAVGLALFGAALPFLPDEGTKNPTAGLVAAVVIFIGFSIAAWYSAAIVRELPSTSVIVDAEGLWLANQQRNISLVKWRDVVQIRERPLLQRLELLDRRGAVLIKLEYQLQGFSRLRTMVIQRANLTKTRPFNGAILRKSVWHHIFNVAAVIGLVALGLYLGEKQPLLGYGGMGFIVAIGSWEYFTTVHSLSLDGERLHIHWPLRRCSLSRTELHLVDLADVFVQYSRHPCVTLLRAPPAKPIIVSGLGVSAIELHRMLSAWKNGAVA